MVGFGRRAAPPPKHAHRYSGCSLDKPLAVSLIHRVVSSVRRKDHPSYLSAITCCFLSSLKHSSCRESLSIGAIGAPLGVNVLGCAMARFSADPTWPNLRAP